MNYQVISILDSVLGQSHKQGSSELYYFCPFCHHYKPKLAVNVVKRKWQCWKCRATGTTLLSLLRRLNVSQGQIRELSELLKDELPRIAKTEDVAPVLALPDEYRPLYKSAPTVEYHTALSYLKSRGITPEDVIRYKIGYCETGQYKNRIIIPSYNSDNTLNYFIGRTYYRWGLNYLTPPISKNLVGLENQINWKYPLVIVEGIFDAMAVRRNAVPLFGKQIPKKLREKIIKEGVKEVYLALDNDALRDTIRHAERLMKEGIEVYVVELSGKDPAELGFAEMQYLIKNATPLSFVGLMQLKMRLS